MDESGNHHSQQTDTRTENQTPHVFTHKQMLNNANTWRQGGEHLTVRPVRGWGAKAGIAGGQEIGEGQHQEKYLMQMMG